MIALKCKKYLTDLIIPFNFCFTLEKMEIQMKFFSFSVTRVLFNHIDKSGLNDNSVEELKKRYGG